MRSQHKLTAKSKLIGEIWGIIRYRLQTIFCFFPTKKIKNTKMPINVPIIKGYHAANRKIT